MEYNNPMIKLTLTFLTESLLHLRMLLQAGS